MCFSGCTQLMQQGMLATSYWNRCSEGKVLCIILSVMQLDIIGGFECQAGISTSKYLLYGQQPVQYSDFSEFLYQKGVS
jgi:hypothetical protein